MIVFDLRCAHSHVFEAWFGSSGAYEDQRRQRLIACPVCGDDDIAKAVMAPNVGAKGNRAITVSATRSDGPPSPDAVRAALATIAAAQAEALKSSQWVGVRFAEQARAMHDGSAPHAPIHGQATREEARALAEEGVPVAPLLVPVVPPEACN